MCPTKLAKEDMGKAKQAYLADKALDDADMNVKMNDLAVKATGVGGDDKAAAVAKTAAIKNIQKALTARILKRLDDGQPLVEVARKMKAIEGMQPQINDMERVQAEAIEGISQKEQEILDAEALLTKVSLRSSFRSTCLWAQRRSSTRL